MNSNSAQTSHSQVNPLGLRTVMLLSVALAALLLSAARLAGSERTMALPLKQMASSSSGHSILCSAAAPEENLAVAQPKTTTRVWKVVGCFLLGFFWIAICGLLARASGGGMIGAVLGLVLGFSMLFSKESGISTWQQGSQVAFWIGMGLMLLLLVLVLATGKHKAA